MEVGGEESEEVKREGGRETKGKKEGEDLKRPDDGH